MCGRVSLCVLCTILTLVVRAEICRLPDLLLDSPVTARHGLQMKCTALLLNNTGQPGDLLVSQVAQAIEVGAVRELQINLVGNDITAEGLQSLTRIIRILPTAVKWLNLGNNPGIGDHGAAALAEALLSKDTRRLGLVSLRSLMLAKCGIGDKGVRALAPLLGLSTLKRLALNNNRSLGVRIKWQPRNGGQKCPQIGPIF